MPTIRYLAGQRVVSSSATCRMTSRGINKTAPAYDLKRFSAISAFSSSRLAGCRHVAARTKVHERYKIGTHPPSVRHRPDPASCRPNLANRSTSIYRKSGSVLRIDAFLTTLARAHTLWAFYSHSAGSCARSHTILRSFRLGRLTG
jgi:hypothetical protein